MTAQEADRGSVVDSLASAAGVHPRTVRDFLRGFPPARDRAAERLRSAAQAAGVDLATIPELPPEEIAERRRDRRGECRECRRLRARVAELESQLASAESRAYPLGTVAAIRAEDAEAAAKLEGKPHVPLAIVRTPAPAKRVVTTLMPGETLPGTAAG